MNFTQPLCYVTEVNIMSVETKLIIQKWQRQGYSIVHLGRQIFAVKGDRAILLYVGGDLVVTVEEEKMAAIA